MALIPIDSLRRQVLRVLDKTDPPAGIELLSYKRDRSIGILCLDRGRFRVIEQGFAVMDEVVDRSDLPRLLKTLCKREFPRSRKVRLVKIDSPEQLERKKVKI